MAIETKYVNEIIILDSQDMELESLPFLSEYSTEKCST